MFIYEIQEQIKSSSVRETRQQIHELRPLRRPQPVGDVALNSPNRFEAGGVSLHAERGHFRPNGAPVLEAAPPLHEPLGLETIDELGDVRPDTAELAGEVSQGHRLAGTDELLHGVELRDGEPYRDKRLLEALPELFRRSEHGHERALVRAGPDGALRLGVVEDTVHTLYYNSII